MICRRCPSTVRSLGRRDVVVAAVEDGRLVRRRVDAPRYSCAACGHVFVDRSETDEWRAIEAVVDAACGSGIAAAARSLSCDEKSVRSLVRRWISLHDEVRDTVPEILGVIRLPDDGSRIAVCDADEIEILDVVSDAGVLADWLKTREGETTIALLPIDAELRACIRDRLPGARLAIAPSLASRTILSMAGRILAAAAPSRRNYREDPSLLSVPDADLSPEAQDDVRELWSPFGRSLRRRVLAMVVAADARSFRAAVGEAVTWLSEMGVGAPLVRLLREWGDAMADGAGQAWLDVAWVRMEALGRAVEGSPAGGALDLLRVALVLRPVRSRSGGVPIVAACDAALRSTG